LWSEKMCYWCWINTGSLPWLVRFREFEQCRLWVWFRGGIALLFCLTSCSREQYRVWIQYWHKSFFHSEEAWHLMTERNSNGTLRMFCWVWWYEERPLEEVHVVCFSFERCMQSKSWINWWNTNY
jgi:hypothetical protein